MIRMSGGSKEGWGKDSDFALLRIVLLSRCAVGMCGAEPRGGQSGAGQLETDAHQETRPYNFFLQRLVPYDFLKKLSVFL